MTGYLFSERAGLWAAIAFNLSPVVGITSASMVLPDGPLICALLLSAYCLARGVFDQTGSTTRWWVLCGACAGVALLTKYSTVLSLAGAGVFLITAPAGRRWLTKPQPYMAAAIALLLALAIVAEKKAHGIKPAKTNRAYGIVASASAAMRPKQMLNTIMVASG